MEHLAPRLDLDMAGMLVANFLQSWLQAGLDLEPQAPQSLHDSQDPTAPSPEDGLHLSAPVDHGPSAPSPGEHRQAIRLEGQGPEPGLAERSDPCAGPGLGPVRQSNNRQDFKTLVADVSLEKVGAVFALEASRLSRSAAGGSPLATRATEEFIPSTNVPRAIKTRFA
jgi:hypothetical protein